MTLTCRISRRHLLLSATSGVLGVAVLGSLTACSTTSSEPDGGATSPSPTGSEAAGSPGDASGDAAIADGSLTWRRVSLSFVSAYLLVRGGEVAVVDTGTQGSAESIGAGLVAAGAGWDAVRHVVLTHKHGDHIGGLDALAREATTAALYAGEQDLAAVPAPGRPLRALADGQEVFGLQVHATPGHTPGHVSVFDPATGVLVAGDALRTTDGLQGSDPQYTDDPAAAAASVRKLAALDVQVILPGHGDPLTEGAAEALTQLAASLPAV